MENSLVFKRIKTPDGKYFYIPKDIRIVFPKENLLPSDIRRSAYIPWEPKYLELCPKQFRSFFQAVLPHLKTRTTDVHTARCLSYIDKLIEGVKEEKNLEINRKVVALGLILHDCGWSALSKKEVADSLASYKGLRIRGKATKPKLKHAEKGVQIAKRVLNHYQFKPFLSEKERELILGTVFWHDKVEKARKKKLAIEIKLVADLDHLWSYTYLNFWQDTIRKDVNPQDYIKNLKKDLDYYFIFKAGRKIAKSLLGKRKKECSDLRANVIFKKVLLLF